VRGFSKKIAKMEELIKTLNFKANNIEEICCGIRNRWEDYNDKKERADLINEIEYELEPFTEALNKLKSIK
jgi:hypothetical protein